MLWVDRVTALAASVLNRMPYMAASKVGVKIQYGRIRYTGTAWVVESSVDSCGLTSGGLNFASGVLRVTLESSYNLHTVAIASSAGSVTYIANAELTESTNAVNVYFRDYAGTQIGTPDTNMNFNLLVFGAAT